VAAGSLAELDGTFPSGGTGVPEGCQILAHLPSFRHAATGHTQGLPGRQASLAAFPGSLIFWGAPPFLKMQSNSPAAQIPLLNVCDRHEAPRGLRILQSGWLNEPRADRPETEKMRDKVRTPTGAPTAGRIEQFQDELAVVGDEVRLAHVLFKHRP